MTDRADFTQADRALSGAAAPAPGAAEPEAAVAVGRAHLVAHQPPEGVLVAAHGPFAWGTTPAEGVLNAAILEHVARLASETLRIDPAAGPIPQPLLDKHFLRKHGPDSYYGQGRGNG